MPPIKDINDLRGASRLTIDAITATTDLVEHMHYAVSSAGGLLGRRDSQRTSGISGLVYHSIRGISKGVGLTLDKALEQLAELYGERESFPAREAVMAALNGVLGDHLAETGNPLAIRMQVRREGRPVNWEDPVLRQGIRDAGGRVLLLVHGLCMSDLQWQRQEHDHGAALARDLGYFPLYLLYNTGQHISSNGQALAQQLQTLVDQLDQPVELTLLNHSMGGLVVRSAWHYAQQNGLDWPSRVRGLVFMGSPHQGAPLERGGNWLHLLMQASPFSAPFARLGRIRSAGITDLRFGALLDEDWKGRDRFHPQGDDRMPVPLPEQVPCYALAASLAQTAGPRDQIPGDGLVPLDSALGRHPDPRYSLNFPPERQKVIRAINHLDLLNHPAAYRTLRDWLESA